MEQRQKTKQTNANRVGKGKNYRIARRKPGKGKTETGSFSGRSGAKWRQAESLVDGGDTHTLMGVGGWWVVGGGGRKGDQQKWWREARHQKEDLELGMDALAVAELALATNTPLSCSLEQSRHRKNATVITCALEERRFFGLAAAKHTAVFALFVAPFFCDPNSKARSPPVGPKTKTAI
jgi:hypothetical protein